MKHKLTKCFGVHLNGRQAQSHYYQLGMAVKDFKDLVNGLVSGLSPSFSWPWNPLKGYHVCCLLKCKVTLELKWLARWDYSQLIICHQLHVGLWKDYKVIKKEIKLVFAASLFSLHLKEHEEVTGITLLIMVPLLCPCLISKRFLSIWFWRCLRSYYQIFLQCPKINAAKKQELFESC